MAEQTFKSPGFFEREIDLSQRDKTISGIPAGIAGTSHMGPAFVPVTVGSFSDFENRFGGLDPDKFGPYAVKEFLKHRTAVTYVRVLGAGANDSTTDFDNTLTAGITKGAGFKIKGEMAAEGSVSAHGRGAGCVQFIVGRHYVSASNEAVGYPMLSDNDSFFRTGGSFAYMVRGMLMCASGTRFEIMNINSGSYSTGIGANNDTAGVGYTADDGGLFKLIISSSAGSTFSSDEGNSGIRIYTASLDPTDDAYIANILNTDPKFFQKEQHLLYAHFPVESEVATLDWSKTKASVALTSGSALTSAASGISTETFANAYGRFDSRFTTPATTWFISQPYGTNAYDLFKVETISDGAYANSKFKISIRDIRKSVDPSSPFATFTLEVRDFDDVDTNAKVLERYPGCTLDKNSSDYIARKIGDFKAYYNFDAEQDSEKMVLVKGQYPNVSSRVRVVMAGGLVAGDVPDDAMPFGFRGLPVVKTSDTLSDTRLPVPGIGSPKQPRRLSMDLGDMNIYTPSAASTTYWAEILAMTGSILPPIPMRFKVTRGTIDKTPTFTGQAGGDERVDGRFYWGIKSTRLPRTGSKADAIFNSNASSELNPIVREYTKFLGIQKLDVLVTGSGADKFNNNMFTLARVALYNSTGSTSGNLDKSIPAVITGSAKEHMLNTAYIRNGDPDPKEYLIDDDDMKRLTFASLASITSSVYFNKFTDYAKFTNIMHGGFDGLNILDKHMANMDDQSCSSDTGGYASGATLDIGLRDLIVGSGKYNANVSSYRAAARILTDEVSSRVNIIVIPGIRDSSLTDYVMERLEDYGKAFYIIDVPSYDADQVRLFDGSSKAPNVGMTAQNFAARSINNNFSAAYFPDVTIGDPINNRPVQVPATVAALGALAYSDSVSYPWFAPAGFNRASLGFVSNTKVRLNQGDRDELYESRVNPIASFPRAGYVIFGQKTLQLGRSALDRVNVRRMLLEVRRVVSEVANLIVFEQNTPETRARFVADVTPLLSNVQSQQGIDQFKVIMDTSNNTSEDIESNVLNGRIVVVPTRAIEFIAIDFIITHSGVSFE